MRVKQYVVCVESVRAKKWYQLNWTRYLLSLQIMSVNEGMNIVSTSGVTCGAKWLD